MSKLSIVALLLWCLPALGQNLGHYQGWCEKGSQQVVTQGLVGSGTIPIPSGTAVNGTGVQASYPQCTITVYLTGTLTLASIFSNNNVSPTPLANPFTANADGSFGWYASTSATYDNVESGAGLAAPFTYSAISLTNPLVTSLALQVNEVPNGSQILLDLHAGTGITLTDNGSGRVTIAASGGGGPVSGMCAVTNAVAKWTASTTLNCSSATDDGTNFLYPGLGVFGISNAGSNFGMTSAGSGAVDLKFTNTASNGQNVAILGQTSSAGSGGFAELSGGSGALNAGNAWLRGGDSSGATGGSIDMTPGSGVTEGTVFINGHGFGAWFYPDQTTFASLTTPPANPGYLNLLGPIIECTDCKGAADGALQGGVAAGSGTGALLWYDGTNKRVLSGMTPAGTTKDFAVTGCTPASSTDSQCTGSITISPAFADANYIPQLTANGNGGSVPNLVVTVNGALSAGSIPYALSCTFDCGTVNAPTIYVHAFHP